MRISCQLVPKSCHVYPISMMAPESVAIIQSAPRGYHNRVGKPVIAISETSHHILGFGLAQEVGYQVRDLHLGEVVAISDQ